jgi:hypothetical protein
LLKISFHSNNILFDFLSEFWDHSLQVWFMLGLWVHLNYLVKCWQSTVHSFKVEMWQWLLVGIGIVDESYYPSHTSPIEFHNEFYCCSF